MKIEKKDVVATLVLVAAAFVGTTLAFIAREKGFMVKKSEAAVTE